MAKNVLIGEISRHGTTVLLYAAPEAYNQLIKTDYNYSGMCDEADRSLHLLTAAQEAISHGKNGFGIEVDDRSWSGRPEDIEKERIAVRLETRSEGILLHTRAESIGRDNPTYHAIATRALEELNRRGFHRNV